MSSAGGKGSGGKPDYSHVAPAPGCDITLEKIRKILRIILALNAAASISTLIMGVIALAEIIYYYPKMSTVLTPERVANTVDNAMVTMAAARNISLDALFFADGARGAASALAPSPARRALLADLSLTPELQQSATSLLNALTAQVQTSDMGAPSAFLRYLMSVDWAASLAPRLDRGLATARNGELLAATVMAALTAANATALAALASGRV
jgi:hypothetical protein